MSCLPSAAICALSGSVVEYLGRDFGRGQLSKTFLLRCLYALFWFYQRSTDLESIVIWQIIEVLLVSLITSLLSFGLPMMTKCKPCPDSVKYPDIVCPRPSGNYGNYVNVSDIWAHFFFLKNGILWFVLHQWGLHSRQLLSSYYSVQDPTWTYKVQAFFSKHICL